MEENDKKMIETIAFGIIAYNEHKYLPDLLYDLQSQTYPHNLIEVILVDGGSTDDTRQIMKEFQEKNRSRYRDIKIVNNLKKIQPAGWNEVIRNYTTDVLLRIDAHARLPEDFILRIIECINTGEFVCGGPRENIIDEDTNWKRMLLAAEQSMFGAGIASYRQKTGEKKYVKSLFHGAYRKEVIDIVGLFNENLIRTEDNEYHYRVRQAGFQICYDPKIVSFYQTRSSLKGMLKQKFLNGLWIGRTLYICPGCISIFHLVPLTFVAAIVLTTIIGTLGITWPAATLWILYWIANITMTAISARNTKRVNSTLLLLPIVFLMLHMSYGIGTVVGIIHR